MIIISFFLITLFLNYCYASEQIPKWEQTAPGSKEEREVISNASRLNYSIRFSTGYFQEFNNFIITHREQIQQKIQEAVQDRVKILQDNLNNKNTIPPLPVFKKNSSQYYDNIDDFNKNVIDDCRLERVRQLMLLYAQLYNRVSFIANILKGECACECDYHHSNNICYLPSLQAELLLEICISLQQEYKKRPNKEKFDGKVEKTIDLWENITKSTQEELSNKSLWEYTLPCNTLSPECYTKHIELCDRIEIKPSYGPWVKKTYSSNPYIPRAMTQLDAVTNPANPDNNIFLPSRQIYRSNTQTEKRGTHNETTHIRFSDDDWGYDFFLEMPKDMNTQSDFNISAYTWEIHQRNDTSHMNYINTCVFAYAYTPYGQSPRYGICKVQLPLWNQKTYGVLITKCPKGNLLLEKGLQQKEYRESFDKIDHIQLLSQVSAVAYDVESNFFLCASDTVLNRAYNNPFSKQSHMWQIVSLDNSIKKILVASAQIYLVVTSDNTLYAVFYSEKSRSEKISTPIKETIIDIDYNAASQQLAILTCDGVYLCKCSVVKPAPQTNQTNKQLQVFRKKLHTSRGNDPTDDTQDWNVDIKNYRKIDNKSFDYGKYAYDTIDFRNGQIYLQGKTKSKQNQDTKCVLIYPLQKDE